jgi:uncharacterized protein (TIGR00296 family)
MSKEPALLSANDGLFALTATRELIVSYLKNRYWVDTPKFYPQTLRRKQGVFVSIVEKIAYEDEERERYCLSVGNPLPNARLIDAAFSAATKVAIDLSSDLDVSSPPPISILRLDIVGDLELLNVTNPVRYTDLVRLGQHGLMTERGHYKGVLLPRVPIAENWNVDEFLSQCCIRAGLMADAWLEKAVRIYRFQTQVFEEELFEKRQ